MNNRLYDNHDCNINVFCELAIDRLYVLVRRLLCVFLARTYIWRDIVRCASVAFLKTRAPTARKQTAQIQYAGLVPVLTIPAIRAIVVIVARCNYANIANTVRPDSVRIALNRYAALEEAAKNPASLHALSANVS